MSSSRRLSDAAVAAPAHPTIPRRAALQAGAVGLLGLGLGDLSALGTLAARAPKRRARSVIFIFCSGGMSHIDTFDPKPEAPDSVRGPLAPAPLISEWAVVASLMALGRAAEALPHIDPLVALADRAAAARKRPDPHLVPTIFSFRIQIHREAKDAPGCRATAELWEKRKPRSAGELYDAACLRAVPPPSRR